MNGLIFFNSLDKNLMFSITTMVIIGFYAANGASSTLVKELRDIVRAKFYCPYHMPLQIKHNNCYLGLHDTSPQQLAHLD